MSSLARRAASAAVLELVILSLFGRRSAYLEAAIAHWARALLVVALLLAAPARAEPIEQYRLPADGQDIAPAFERAQLACAGRPCDLEFNAAAYSLTRPLDVCVPTRITGKGVPPSGSAVYTSRTTAVRTFARGNCPNAALKAYAGELAIERLTFTNVTELRPTDPGNPAEAPFYGLEPQTRVELTDVFFSGFVHGLHLECAAREGGTNCNLSRFDRVKVTRSEHAGVYVRGPDANQMLFTGGRSDTNCHHAERWNAEAIKYLCSKHPTHAVCSTQRFQCAGYQDLSWLGNTYVGTHTATEYGPGGAVRYAGYVFAHPGQMTTAHGVYQENDSEPGFADQRVTILGGPNVFDGPAGQIHASTMPALTVTNGSAWISFGRDANRTDAVWSIGGAFKDATGAPFTGTYPFKLVLDPKTGTLNHYIGNSLRNVGAVQWVAP